MKKINFLGEMLDGRPMFPGKHYLDQISKILVSRLRCVIKADTSDQMIHVTLNFP